MEEVLRGGVGLLRLVEGKVESLVDHLPLVEIGPVDERDRDAGGAGAAGAADAVDVGLLIVGGRVVDHVGDAGDVDAAGGDVGGHQDLDLAVTELLHHPLAGGLLHVAVQGRGREAALGEVVGHTLCLSLGAGEDDDLVVVLALQQAADHLGLVEVVGLVDELGRGRDGLGLGRGLGADVHRVAHVGAGQGHDRARHGGREQQRLAGLRGERDQLLHVGQEPQVEHLVGLVEDEGVHVGEVENLAVGQVDQAARGADDDVDALLQRVDLGLVAGAAVDGQHAEAAVLGDQRDLGRDLHGQLAGRGHDQRLRLALRKVDVVAVLGGHAALHDRDAEGQRLAGAGAGLADQVGALQSDREGHLLDGEGGGDAFALERSADLGMNPEVLERCHDFVATRFVSSNAASDSRVSRACQASATPRTYGIQATAI